MSEESAISFFNRYHRYPPRMEGRVVTPVFDLDYVPKPKYDDIPTDAVISLPECEESWPVHSKVIIEQSNLFRMALALPFSESTSKEIKLYDIDVKIMKFIVKYMYKDWHSAVVEVFKERSGDAVSPSKIAEVLIVADYLDMPQLCYSAYRMFLCKIADLVEMTKTEALYSHTPYRARMSFLRAAVVLEKSRTKVGLDLADATRKLMDKLRVARDLNCAVEAFMRVFPDDSSIIKFELQWHDYGIASLREAYRRCQLPRRV
ncbi:hypothetical protein F4814DRAFT_273961 [Daldinia grandis]|nr:hypothetical protein F4814DRAFT_273961 [Daldinia grandis]